MPVAGPGEILVKFHAASLNYRDVMVVSGTYNPRMKMPAVPFSDGAGEVVEVGDGVTKWKAGDRVLPIFAQSWIEGEISEEKRRHGARSGAILGRCLAGVRDFRPRIRRSHSRPFVI